MLFNFRLKPIEDVSLFGDENHSSLHWYGLTDGWFWLSVGNDELFHYNEALIGEWISTDESCSEYYPYVDYYIVRLWEDMQDILPNVLEPIPETIIRRCNPGQYGWQYLQQREAWFDKYDDSKTWITATQWLSDRKLDAGYLLYPPHIHFWTEGITMFITWDNRDCQEDSIPFWSTIQGQFAIPLLTFIDEIRSFDERLIAEMAVRVQSAQIDWPLPNVEIDLDYLKIDHQDRATWMNKAFRRAQKKKTDWDEVMAAMDLIEKKIR